MCSIFLFSVSIISFFAAWSFSPKIWSNVERLALLLQFHSWTRLDFQALEFQPFGHFAMAYCDFSFAICIVSRKIWIGNVLYVLADAICERQKNSFHWIENESDLSPLLCPSTEISLHFLIISFEQIITIFMLKKTSRDIGINMLAISRTQMYV